MLKLRDGKWLLGAGYEIADGAKVLEIGRRPSVAGRTSTAGDATEVAPHIMRDRTPGSTSVFGQLRSPGG